MSAPRNYLAKTVWPAVLGWIRLSFPGVRQISTDDLARLLEDGGPAATTLLDVRSPEEYAVSHIAGAERLDHQLSDAEVAGRWPPDSHIITYCSIGYRSSAAATRLTSLGYQNVSNLEGSLFVWAERGHPIECEGESARQVHPYNRLWGYLLPRRLRAPIHS